MANTRQTQTNRQYAERQTERLRDKGTYKQTEKQGGRNIKRDKKKVFTVSTTIMYYIFYSIIYIFYNFIIYILIFRTYSDTYEIVIERNGSALI
jgi:hypothetical protein